jgi:tripartite-type tricarboxylate transporter receptor subunit TctC
MHSKTRRRLAGSIAALPVLGTTSVRAQEAFPARPIRVIVPFSPGASDTQIRALAPLVSARLGQQMTVENAPGGGGVIGANRVRTAPADGYTLFFTGMATLTLVPAMRTDVPFKLSAFTPVAGISNVTGVMIVHANSPYRTFAELVAAAKQNPGTINFASPGVGSAGHTMGLGPQTYGGFTMTHVPYKGGADVVQAVLSESVQVGCVLPSLSVPQMQAGRLRALAVTAGKRSEFLPDVPTYREAGIDYTDSETYGLVAPQGTPEAVVQKIAEAVAESVKDPAFRETMRKTFTSVEYLSPAQYRAALLERERDWQKHLANPAFRAQLQ